MSEPVRVLHVDDDRAFCELAREFLQRHDLDVLIETSAADGLERLSEADVECVVSDYDMPGMDGLAFLDAVREHYPDLPFILFTGRGNEEVASDAISAGVSDYLQKDGATEQYELLANRVRNYAEQYRTRAAVETARRRYELAGTVASDVIYEHDIAADETVFTDGFEDVFGYDQDLVCSRSWWRERIHPEDRDRVVDRLTASIEAGETSTAIEYRFRDASGEYHYLSEDRYVEYRDGDPVRIVGAFRDVTARRRREERLDTLHEATRSLVASTTVTDAVTTASVAGEDILDLPINAVFLEADDRLVPVAHTDRTVEILGSVPTFGPGEGIVWEVFESGQPCSFGDVRESESVYNPETPIRSELHVPLGSHGVFVAASTDVADFTEADLHLATVLAATLQAALDRLTD